MPDLPRFLLPGAPAGFSIGATLETLPWHLLPALPLVLAEDGGVPVQPTELRLAASAERLWVRFDCRDDEPWSTFTQRDEPLWQEEVVEVFLAAGGEPLAYPEADARMRSFLTWLEMGDDQPTTGTLTVADRVLSSLSRRAS